MGKRLLAFSLIAVVLFSCSFISGQPADDPVSDTPSTVPPASPTTVLEPTPVPKTSPVPTKTPEPITPPTAVGLSENGPWWIFTTGETIWTEAVWAINSDGTGLTRLLDHDFMLVRNLSSAISPGSGDLAFLTASDFQRRGLTLNLVQLPGGQIQPITPLSSPETETAPNADPAFRPPEPLLAVSETSSLAWSPDGQSLAFMGAFEGPSSDLYVYSQADGTVTRLTDGPAEGIQPHWSPDGKYILHFGVWNLGTGAGASMAGAWAARADNSEVVTLYDPSDSGGEVLIGWTDDETFVVHSFNAVWGPVNLRMINIDSGEINTLWEGSFRGVALDPKSGNLLVLANETTTQFNPEIEIGVYHITPDGTSLRILSEDPIIAAWSEEAGLFFVRTEFGLVGITPSGDWNQLHDISGRLPIASPTEKVLALYGEGGLWVGNLISSIEEAQPAQIFSGQITHATWDPAGEHILFFGDGDLYVASKPDFPPRLVGEGLTSRDSAWVSGP